jgi:hypothetical protein
VLKDGPILSFEGGIPSARSGFGVAVVGEKLFIHGGNSEAGSWLGTTVPKYPRHLQEHPAFPKRCYVISRDSQLHSRGALLNYSLQQRVIKVIQNFSAMKLLARKLRKAGVVQLVLGAFAKA